MLVELAASLGRERYAPGLAAGESERCCTVPLPTELISGPNGANQVHLGHVAICK